jgi:hypothetical protein
MKVRKIQDYIKSYALLQHMFRTKYWAQETEGSDTDLIQEVSSTLPEVLEENFNVMQEEHTHIVKSGSDDKSDYWIQMTSHYLAITRLSCVCFNKLLIPQPNNLTL